ncbi:MAG: DUF4389 domain-containing protein [Dehalococcoidia bacterium]|nr:DUF4389 domain-containing protein [Dehalococcoidia bacterium]
MSEKTDAYPVHLSIDYEEGPRNQLTAVFRLFVAVPIVIVLGLLSGSSVDWQVSPWSLGMASAGMVVLPTVAMMLFRQKYPRWWFDWNLELSRFAMRVAVYLMLLRDEYPSTDEEQSVHLDITYPDVARELGSGMPLVKWLLAIPHLFVLAFLGIAVFFCVVASWFTILFTGRQPNSLAEFLVGYLRWEIRVMAYAFLLTTDVYPPFSLD